MFFQEVAPGAVLHLNFENGETGYREATGIVLSTEDEECTFLSNCGDVLTIPFDKLLDACETSIDKDVETLLRELKQEMEDIKGREKELSRDKDALVKKKTGLHDAVFLARFNLWGAKTRLENSIPVHNQSFIKDGVKYDIGFSINENHELQMTISIAVFFEHYTISTSSDIEKAIRIHCPSELEKLKSVFPFCQVFQEKNKRIAHVKDETYAAVSEYHIVVEVEKSTFIEMRSKIEAGLCSLSR